MINLPQSTIVNRFVPKEKFYSKTAINTKLRDLFTSEIEKITWVNKISPTTLNISEGEYKEMQIFEIMLKKSEINSQLLKHIDTYIPYPILFILNKPSGAKLILSYKEPASSKNSLMKVTQYFETGWQKEINIELKGRSVDDIYKNFLHQIAPHLDLKTKPDVRSAIETNQAREEIIKQIDDLNRVILREPSVAKQQEIARKRHQLEQEL